MHFQALLSFTVLTICATVFAYPHDLVVKYGSGSSFVERAPADCPLDPGAVCGALAGACGAALMTPTAPAVWKLVACVCAGLW